jgi:hypothetical protein
MKKIEVLSVKVDTMWDHSVNTQLAIERWIKTEEGQFIEKHSKKPIEMRTIRQPHSPWDDKVELLATLEEKHETFWRLKFK